MSVVGTNEVVVVGKSVEATNGVVVVSKPVEGTNGVVVVGKSVVGGVDCNICLICRLKSGVLGIFSCPRCG